MPSKRPEPLFSRIHHQAIAQVLRALNAELFKESACYFGGGTAIAMKFGEYRESVDMDFIVSSKEGYRDLRQSARKGLEQLFASNVTPFEQSQTVRIDHYGIRTMINVVGREVKFEIVFEGRINLDDPGPDETICGVTTLTTLDMATSKLLANSDRCFDDGAFNRDLIDLAMMKPSRELLLAAVTKAEDAYGNAILKDLDKAIDRLQNRPDWLERCMEVMGMNMPRAVLWKHVRALRRLIPEPGA